MNITLLCPGNLNLGDNAILFTWLGLMNRFLRRKDTVTVLGVETSYIFWHVYGLKYKVVCSDYLHRHFWKYPQTTEGWQAAQDDLLRENPLDTEDFMPEYYALHEIFSKSDCLHIIGGGCLNNKWRDLHYITRTAVELAHRYGKKIIFTGQTIGPLDPEDEERLRPLFQKAAWVDLRDHSCEE